MAKEAASLNSVCRNSSSGPLSPSDATALQHLHHYTMSTGTLPGPRLAFGILRPGMPTRLMPHATYLKTQVPSLRTEISNICHGSPLGGLWDRLCAGDLCPVSHACFRWCCRCNLMSRWPKMEPRCGNIRGGPHELLSWHGGVSEDRCCNGGGKGAILPWPSPRNDLSMSIYNVAVQTGKGTTPKPKPSERTP